jgi:phenylpropionate dioxygenase-like ring-hydroxylating dioxygenase large terminal subunit
MGEDNVIVQRDGRRRVQVMLNTCPHRGMKVCPVEAGNARAHRCVYHGWTFRSDGSFIGAPVEKEEMHGDRRSKEELGLKRARVRLYGGLILATWDHSGPSFEEFLGESRFYFASYSVAPMPGLKCWARPRGSSCRATGKTPMSNRPEMAFTP